MNPDHALAQEMLGAMAPFATLTKREGIFRRLEEQKPFFRGAWQPFHSELSLMAWHQICCFKGEPMKG